jgi:transcriptional regulator with XRE-family HTH domain
MTIQECLAQNLRFYRKRKNLSQSQLAEKAETSTNYIANIKNWQKYPFLNTLEKIVKVLKIRAINLFQLKIDNDKCNLEVEEFKKKLKHALIETIVRITD